MGILWKKITSWGFDFDSHAYVCIFGKIDSVCRRDSTDRKC